MVPSDQSGGAAAGDLAALDEILQVMYWLKGERLAESVTAEDLVRWIGLETVRVGQLLERLAAVQLVEQLESTPEGLLRFQLTAAGAHEGGRRFSD